MCTISKSGPESGVDVRYAPELEVSEVNESAWADQLSVHNDNSIHSLIKYKISGRQYLSHHARRVSNLQPHLLAGLLIFRNAVRYLYCGPWNVDRSYLSPRPRLPQSLIPHLSVPFAGYSSVWSRSARTEPEISS